MFDYLLNYILTDLLNYLLIYMFDSLYLFNSHLIYLLNYKSYPINEVGHTA
jgi:hypothetical protein